MIYTATSHLLEKYDTDMIIEISRDSCNTFDFYKAEELVETGRLQAREMLRKQAVAE
jgi:predicted acylesterase/phospholipase RssA